MKNLSGRFTAHPFNVYTLKKRLDSILFNTGLKAPPLAIYLDAISACWEIVKKGEKTPRALPQSLKSQFFSNDLKIAGDLAWKVVCKAQQDISSEWDSYLILKRYLTLLPRLRTDPQNELQAILSCKDYNHRLDLGYISLRFALLERDINFAFDILDACSGNNTARSSSTPQLVASTSLAMASILGAGIIDFPLSTFMLGISGSTIAAEYLAITKTPRISWKNYVPISYQVKNHDILVMANRIVTGVDELMDININNFHRKNNRQYEDNDDVQTLLRKYLRDRGMKLIDGPDEEAELYHEYWKTAGKGSQWVEPDQDPTDKFL